MQPFNSLHLLCKQKYHTTPSHPTNKNHTTKITNPTHQLMFKATKITKEVHTTNIQLRRAKQLNQITKTTSFTSSRSTTLRGQSYKHGKERCKTVPSRAMGKATFYSKRPRREELIGHYLPCGSLPPIPKAGPPATKTSQGDNEGVNTSICRHHVSIVKQIYAVQSSRAISKAEICLMA